MGAPGTGLAALGDGFPTGGPVPRHPSQLYQALLEGLVLFLVMLALSRVSAPRPLRLSAGAFLVGYGIARVIGELFRQPDVFLGFSWVA